MLDTLGRLLTRCFFDRPIFIVGGSRSGTIALLKSMGQHPEILITPSEDPFIVDIGNIAYSLEVVSEEERTAYLRALRIDPEYIRNCLRRLALESALGRNYGLKYLLKVSIKQAGQPWSKRYWCTKTFPTERSAQGLLRLYPGTKFIWILRNGINVVHSRTKFPEFRDKDFSEQCEHWSASIRRFAYLFDMEEAVVVRQEDFLEDPIQSFELVCQHVGIPYHPGPAEYAKTHHVHPLEKTDTAKGVDVKKVLSERPPVFDSWPKEWKETFKAVCGDAMRRVGYEIPF